MRNKFGNIIWGLIFIAIGVFISGYAFDLFTINLFFKGFWTLFIIIPSIIGFIKYGFKTSSMVGLIIGILLLLSVYDYISISTIIKLIIPTILVLIGLQLVFRNIWSNHTIKANVAYTGNLPEYCAVFGENKVVLRQNFVGASISAIFGSAILDLSYALIEENTIIQFNAIFGGGLVILPTNVKVKVSNIPVFGGVDKKYCSSSDSNAPTVYINSTCLFGGIEVR